MRAMDTRKTVAEMSGEWLRESSVLIAVFAWLDERVRGVQLSVEWVVEAGSIVLLLFALGVVAERVRKD
jgi:hypothetical protein